MATTRTDNHKNGNVLTAMHAAEAPSANIQRIENSLYKNSSLFTRKRGMGAAEMANLPRDLVTRLMHVKRGYENYKDEGWRGGGGKTSVGENVRFFKVPGAQAIMVLADVPKAAQADDRESSMRMTVLSSVKNDKGQYAELLKGDVRVSDGLVRFTNKAAFYDQHRQAHI